MGGTFPEKGPFLVCVLKRIIAHLSSHKMPLSRSLSNGNINFFCILEGRVILTSSPSRRVFVCVKETLSVSLHASVYNTYAQNVRCIILRV